MIMVSRIFFLLGLLFSNSQATTNPVILYPGEGEVIEGIVEIRGSVPGENFASAKLSFAYAGENAEDWFLIANIDAPTQEEILGVWDTTTITDGTYQIRLRVREISGEKKDVIVTGIQVANYSRSDSTANDMVTTVTEVPPTQVALQSIVPSPTSLPANPATITETDLRHTALTGLLIGIGLVVLVVLWSLFNHR